jgi:hypothetical protein
MQAAVLAGGRSCWAGPSKRCPGPGHHHSSRSGTRGAADAPAIIICADSGHSVAEDAQKAYDTHAVAVVEIGDNDKLAQL